MNDIYSPGQGERPRHSFTFSFQKRELPFEKFNFYFQFYSILAEIPSFILETILFIINGEHTCVTLAPIYYQVQNNSSEGEKCPTILFQKRYNDKPLIKLNLVEVRKEFYQFQT